MDSATAKSRLDWTAIAGGVALSYAVFLVAMFFAHDWLRDASGMPIANDFVDVFAAGRLAAAGHAASAYDWNIHRAAEVASVGHDFPGYFGWHYPPPFLFIAVALALLPYLASFFFWMAITLPAYAWIVSRIAGKRDALLWALAFPAVLLDVSVGQNGLFTAALFGAMLLTLEDRSVLSGVFLGLLTYKPQFGILIPVALLAGGHWRALGSATLTTLVIGMLSLLAFGSQAWIAFFHSVPHTTQMILAGGHAGWNKLQTVYGFMRWTGASDAEAWGWQLGAGGLLALGIAFMWRSRMPYSLKAAALCAATLLATPYAYIYDFPLLALAIAFLYRHRPFDDREAAILFSVTGLIAIFPWFDAPVGLAATLLVASLVSRRGRKLAPARDVALQHA
ncbi:MAG TPA: glycosyltransferase family 87 protein [Rhizomicrobium sp.]|nr:glycosyltransferase family 87 protein [Rhizomicrobium sp.]